jgi:hypothetical protein
LSNVRETCNQDSAMPQTRIQIQLRTQSIGGDESLLHSRSEDAARRSW